ncbi:cold-shock protein, partial [Vibrio parahaemolyticus]
GIVGAGFYLFGIEPTLNPEYENMGFSCQGKTYCSEMVSCNEAKFYLSNCPNVKIDGDNDGIPCESQF